MEDAKKFFEDNQLSVDIWNNKYRYNNESFEEWCNRVSANNAHIKKLIKEKKFLFGGRTLTNRGTNRGSYSNCYSRGFVEDSLVDILDAVKDISLTYQKQGGQGLSLSKLRPAGTKISNGYTSDGIIPFMKLFNRATDSISQGGSRKGALLISLDAEHKEIEDFINIKSNHEEINKANLSVEITNNFMRTVDHYMSTGFEISYNAVREYDSETISYAVEPVKIFKLIADRALKHAEPGVIFTDQFRNYNLMEFVDEYQIETCNPCGEQPLPKHGACNLGSINLSEYVLDPFTSRAKLDIESFQRDVEAIVRAMDELIDENANNHALPQQKEMSLRYRNIGIGIMGVADMFAKLSCSYGSEPSIYYLKTFMSILFRCAIKESVELGREKGNFPGYNPKVWDATILKQVFTAKEIEDFKKQGYLRNASLLSIAPAGSIGTMLDVSTGIEPFFSLEYNRKTESLHGEDKYYTVQIKALQEYQKITGNKNIPEWFNVAADIHYRDRIKIQEAAQRYVDTAISSTINLPKSTTLEDIMELYRLAWAHNLKGCTVFVEGSRPAILSTTKEEIFPQYDAPKRPRVLPAHSHTVTVAGTKYAIIIGLLEDKPYEVFAAECPSDFKAQHGKIIKVKKLTYNWVGENGDELNDIRLMSDNAEERACTLLISMLLRHGAKISFVVKTLKKVNPIISSFASAIGRVLGKYTPKEEETIEESCPECGETMGGKVIREGGCKHCDRCTYNVCLTIAAKKIEKRSLWKRIFGSR